MEDPNAAEAEEATLPPGSRLGKYEVVRQLGAGGMGAVYEAIHTEMGKRVAIKTLSPAVAEIPGARARFLREAQLTSKVRHPHIVDVSDVGTDGGRAFLVMELLRGEDLSQRLERSGPMAARELCDVMLPVCSALVAAHDAAIVHRDLKPQNIFLATGPHGIAPKVLDFGISKGGDALAAGALTRTGSVIGTPYYLAPEQIQDARAATPSSDQYALGVILYECLAGRRPFGGDSLFSVFNAIVTERPTPLAAVRSDLPAGLDGVVERAMNAQGAARFPDVRALGRALLPFASAKAQLLWAEAFGVEGVEAPEPAPAAPPTTKPNLTATTPYGVSRTPPPGRAAVPSQPVVATMTTTPPVPEPAPSIDLRRPSRGPLAVGVLVIAAIGAAAAIMLRPSAPVQPAAEAKPASPPAAAVPRPEAIAPAPPPAPAEPRAAAPEPVAAPAPAVATPEPKVAAPEAKSKHRSSSGARRRGPAAAPAAPAPEVPATTRRSFNPNGAPVID
jgi:serine/threonine-protein kinase